MNQYRIKYRKRLPAYFYRVQYPSTRTGWGEADLEATDITTEYGARDIARLKADVQKHFNWKNREPTPFVTVFSDREHAENWALREPWSKGLSFNPCPGEWFIYVIQTSLLVDGCVFNLGDLVDRLNLHLPERVEQHKAGAYLFLHYAPGEAIVDQWTPEQVGRNRSKRSLERDYDYYLSMAESLES